MQKNFNKLQYKTKCKTISKQIRNKSNIIKMVSLHKIDACIYIEREKKSERKKY